MPTDEEIFYSKIRSRAMFDEGINAIAGNALANLSRLLIGLDKGFGGSQDTHNVRFMLTFGAKKITEQMIAELRLNFSDVDKFLATGEFPDYLDENTKRLLTTLLKMRRDMLGI